MEIYMEQTLGFIQQADPDRFNKIIKIGELKSIKNDQIRYLKII